MTDPTPHSQPEAELRPAGEFLLIMFRAFAGYMLMFVFAMLMLKRPQWQLSLLDACFWGVLLILAALRLRDQTPGRGRFLMGLGAVGALVWALVNALHWTH